MNDQQPIPARPLVPHDADVAGSAALKDLVALDDVAGELRNRVCHLNIAGSVLGGQIAAHLLVAAAQGNPGFLPCSLHLVFASSPNRARDWRLEVEALRNGRRFGQRLTRLTQDGRTMAHASVVLKAEVIEPELAITHLPTLPDLPPPEDLPSRRELEQRENPDEFRRQMLRSYPFMDIREVPASAQSGLPPAPGSRAYFWLRMPKAAGLDQITQQALLTVASDFWFALPVQILGAQQGILDPILTTSLDHCVWFHSHIDCSEWMLFETEATVAVEGAGLKRAMIWSREGKPLANVVQQSLARIWPGLY